MKRAWVIVVLGWIVAGCSGSTTTMGYPSDQGVTLYVERPEEGLGKGAKQPQPVEGWKALAAEVRFPEAARRARVKGEVLVDLIVDETGSVLAVNVKESPGYGCDRPVQDAVSRTPFKPGWVDGRPAQRMVSLVFRFERALAFTVGRTS